MRLKRVRRVEAMFRAGPGFAEAVRATVQAFLPLELPDDDGVVLNIKLNGVAYCAVADMDGLVRVFPLTGDEFVKMTVEEIQALIAVRDASGLYGRVPGKFILRVKANKGA